MRYFLFSIFIFIVFSNCKKTNEINPNEVVLLTDYLEINEELEQAELIACAGGTPDGFLGQPESPSSVFFYPIEGAYDFRYFESDDINNPNDFSRYRAKDLPHIPVFNGYLRRFLNTPFEGERMGIVTYRTPGKLHRCNPIRQKTNAHPTEINPSLVEVDEMGIHPKFIWQDGLVQENAIYFQVISDSDENLISGTYTFEPQFTFYELDNVVLNITDSTSLPTLEPDQQYYFTMMGVSEDNWVNLLIEKEFSTN